MLTLYRVPLVSVLTGFHLYLAARKTYLHRKKRYLQARRVHGFPDSLVLLNLVCIEVDILIFHLSFKIRDKILYFIAFTRLKSLPLRSGSYPVSCFSPRAEIPFRLHGIFLDFSARLPGHFSSGMVELRPGLNPSPCDRQFGFKRIYFRSRAEISARAKIRHLIRP